MDPDEEHVDVVRLASATLLVLAAIPIGREAVRAPVTIAIVVVGLPLLLSKKVNTLWIVGGAAFLSFALSMVGLNTLLHGG